MAKRRQRTTKNWLESFLQDRGLEEPDARLLRDYECSDREYMSLADALDRAGRPSHLVQAFSYGVPLKNQRALDDHDLVMPAFVLYGSEWFRRDWDGKRRKVWRRLMQGIGWSDSEYWELYPAMASGLAWWNHRFIKLMKTHYLETIAYQAGVVAVTGIVSTPKRSRRDRFS